MMTKTRDVEYRILAVEEEDDNWGVLTLIIMSLDYRASPPRIGLHDPGWRMWDYDDIMPAPYTHYCGDDPDRVYNFLASQGWVPEKYSRFEQLHHTGPMHPWGEDEEYQIFELRVVPRSSTV